MDTITREKRNYQRVHYGFIMHYRDLKKPGMCDAALLIRNISRDGVSFRTGQFIPLAERLVFEILLPSVEKPIKAVSKVIWIRKDPLTKRYLAGGKFLEISKEDRESLASFCG